MKPLRTKAGGKQQIANIKSIPAPTAGWHVGDNQAAPPLKTAVVLDNAFPQLDYVRVRGGSAQWASGMGSNAVSSLLVWTNGVTSRMFAVSNGSIYDASNVGAVGNALVTGLQSSFVDTVQFTGFGKTYLIAINGSDPVQVFDGNAWNSKIVYSGVLATGNTVITGFPSTTGLQIGMALSGVGVPAGSTITALTSSSITISNAPTSPGTVALTFYQNAPVTGFTGTAFSAIWIYKGRLYFAETASLNAWYLGLVSIGGPSTKFPLAPFFKFGGYLLTGSTWAIDSTSGIYEACVFISSEGEVLMYNGDYPGAVNWQLLGSYKVSRPLGPRCLLRAGGDLLIMTEDGIVAMSKVETLDQVALQNEAVTRPIAPEWRNAVNLRQGLVGWQIVSWPLETMVVINIPKLTVADRTQYIANSRSGAWARYLGWDANCFAVFNNQLFYGTSDGRVIRGEIGGSDDTVGGYTTTVMLAFDPLDAPGRTKQVRMVKPYVQSVAAISPRVTVNVDYDVTVPTGVIDTPAQTGALWDAAVWDTDVWGGKLTTQTGWVSVQGLGQAIAVCWQISTNSGTTSPDVRVAAFDVMSEPGSPLG